MALLLCGLAQAEPIVPGDSGLRHDITLLSDAGVMTAPISGWPLSRGDLTGLESADDLAPHLAAARRRVLAALGTSNRVTLELAGMDRDLSLRGFESVPREDGELRVGAGWRQGRYSVRLRLARVLSPDDDREWRADGSQAGVRLGNWWLGASVTDRWWGPGWDGSLILSNNARPVPALVLQRHRALPFGTKWLSWLGPWTTQVVWGQLEGNRDRDNARLFGWRVGIRPLDRFEVAVSRTSQWCGSGRPCDASTFVDLLSGVRDNRGENVDIADEPGNQLAGWDARYTFRALSRPWAIYAQRIGEDERNGLPSANLTMLGMATWGADYTGGSYRLHLEYAETACGGITGSDPIFGCAYEHAIYTDGYRYRGRSLGHSQDGDGRVFSMGVLWNTAEGHQWRAGLRSGRLNRDGQATGGIVDAPADVLDLRLSHKRPLRLGSLAIGIGAEHLDAEGGGSTWYGRGYVSWQLDVMSFGRVSGWSD